MLPITSSCAAAVATSGIIAFRIILNLRNAEPLERIPPGHSARKRKQTLCFQLFVHLLDKALTSVDNVISKFNDYTTQISGFGGSYTTWLTGFWGIIPAELQIALTFSVICMALGAVGKKLLFS